MDIPPPSPEKKAELDATLVEVLAAYDEKPYMGRDPHGLFPYVLNLVGELRPQWSGYQRSIMAAAAVGDIAGRDLAKAKQAAADNGIQWRDL